MMDQITGDLRSRLDGAAQTLHPTPDLVDGAQRRYRRRRTGGAVLATGAAVAVFAAAISVPALLSDRPSGVSNVAVSEPAAVSAAPAPAGQEVVSSGRTYTLPAGFRTTSFERTELGPDKPDVNDLVGASEVTVAYEGGGPGANRPDITLATYEGEVGADGNEQVSDPHFFGGDPARQLRIAGHEAWVSTVTEVPSTSCAVAEPGPSGGIAKKITEDQECVDSALLPYVTLEVEVSSTVHLSIVTDGVSEEDVLAIAASGLS